MIVLADPVELETVLLLRMVSKSPRFRILEDLLFQVEVSTYDEVRDVVRHCAHRKSAETGDIVEGIAVHIPSALTEYSGALPIKSVASFDTLRLRRPTLNGRQYM